MQTLADDAAADQLLDVLATGGAWTYFADLGEWETPTTYAASGVSLAG